MKFSKSLFLVGSLVASVGASANAQVVGSLGGGFGTFLGLSAPGLCSVGTPCTLGGSLGSIVGGTVYANDLPFADIPAGTIQPTPARFLAAGPTSVSPATLTFSAPQNYFSFLWGSPDTYNTLTINSTVGPAQMFTAASLGFALTNGNQAFSQYVQFTSIGASKITSVVFSSTQDAFEAANFSTTVPEPSTYALMAAGLMALGFASKRRKQA